MDPVEHTLCRDIAVHDGKLPISMKAASGSIVVAVAVPRGSPA